MNDKSQVFLRVLLNRFHRTNPAALLKSLPEKEYTEIQALDLSSNDFSPAFAKPSELISKIHYSWLLPAIKRFPNPVQESLLAALPDSASAKLKSSLGVLSKQSISMGQPIREFLIHKIYSQIKPSTVLPIQYLPSSPLSFLLVMSKPKLVEMIDFMGLYDLAEGLRYIIDKNRLKKLLDCLSPGKRQFLRDCMRQKEKIAATRLSLTNWDGSCEKLNEILHRRGLLRLSKAICGQHPDFIWHLTHRLDSGRGEFLKKHYTAETTVGITPALVQQLLNVDNFLNPKSDS